MSVRLLRTEEAWAEIAPILTALTSRAGSPPVLSDRMCIAAVLSLARTGTPWRDLPAACGHGEAVDNRLRRWERRGRWRQRSAQERGVRTIHASQRRPLALTTGVCEDRTG